MSPCELADRLRASLDDPEFTVPPSPEQRRPAEAWAAEVAARGDAAFVLEAPAGPEFRLEWDYIWTVYHEFISVSPDGRKLTFGVIGYD